MRNTSPSKILIDHLNFSFPDIVVFALPVQGCLSQFAIREAGQKIVYILGFRLLSEGPDVKNAMLRRC